MSENLKVGYFVKMYPRLSETFILNEILELERSGIEVTIFSLLKPDEGRFHPQVAQLKARVIYLDKIPESKFWQQFGDHWPALAARRDNFWELFEELMVAGESESISLFMPAAVAAAQMMDLGLDCLHAHFASAPSTVAYFVSRMTGLDFSFTAHAKDIFIDSVNRDLLERKINAARFVATVTEFNKRHILSSFPTVPTDKVKVLYNGIDLEVFKTEPEAPRTPGLILAIGRLVPKKGFPDLLMACSLLKQKGVPFQCVIVGGGLQLPLLESMRRELALEDSVDLVGPKTQVEVSQYLKRAQVFVLPCTVDSDGNQDALPTVLLEALGSGCPVVSTTISGVPEIVDHEVDGLLVTPGDSVMIAEAIEKILTIPQIAAQFALQGREKAEDRFDLKKNVAALGEQFNGAYWSSTSLDRSELGRNGDTKHIEDIVSIV